MRSSIIFLCWSVALLAGQTTVRADVELTTADGRVLTGVVDSRTTDAVLWIRQESEEIVLATPVGWSEIASVTIDGQPADVADLIEQRDILASEQRVGFLLDYATFAPSEAKYVPRRLRVTSLEMEARLVNLDRDVEPDGYEIAVAAVDEAGHNAPVTGDLYVRLMGERNNNHTGRRYFQDLQQWSLPVSPHDFEEGVAMYVLPYRALDPEFDDELCTSGQLNARLGVPGDGNFATTVPVVLREFNSYRDRLQTFAGSRFFRNELSRHVRPRDDDPHGMYRDDWAD